jgi:hypothetical protein
VPQRVYWLEDANVLDKRLVPEEAQEKGHDQEVNEKHNKVIDSLLAIARRQNIFHLFIRDIEKSC